MDFHSIHQAAIKLAGTVALPSPFPAHGSLWIVVAPEDGDFETYIRIVQVVSGKRIITRLEILAGRGDRQLVQAGATERTRSDLSGRHLDHLIEDAGAGVSAHRAASVDDDPDADFRIDSEAVGKVGLHADLDERAPPRQARRPVVVKHVDTVRLGIKALMPSGLSRARWKQ